MPSEGSGTWMETGTLEDVPTPVLSFVPERGPDPGVTYYRLVVLGCGDGRVRFGCRTRRAVVQHRPASGVCVSGWMCFPHAYLARTCRNASGRNHLQERRVHKHKKPQESRLHLEVSV